MRGMRSVVLGPVQPILLRWSPLPHDMPPALDNLPCRVNALAITRRRRRFRNEHHRPPVAFIGGVGCYLDRCIEIDLLRRTARPHRASDCVS